MSILISRRNAIAKIAGGMAVSASVSPLLAVAGEGAKGNLKAGVDVSSQSALERLCEAALSLGLSSVELQGPKQWPVLKKYGLTCNLASGADLGRQRGFSEVQHHAKLIASYKQVIPQMAKAGLSNLICYSGVRGELNLEAAMANSAAGLKQVLKLAERNKVTLYMELTNNSVNSDDYDPEFGVQYSQLAQRIGSERFNVLREVCQLQTLPQSAAVALQKYHPYLGYYYPAGLPKQTEFAKSQGGTVAVKMLQYNRAVGVAV